MKYFTFLLFYVIFFFECKAQTIQAELVFENAAGLIQNDIRYFEVEGYTIFEEKRNFEFTDKGFKKVRSLYSIPKSCEMIDSPEFPFAKVFVDESNPEEKGPHKRVFYLFPNGDDGIRIIGLNTIKSRNLELEVFFVKSLFQLLIPKSVYNNSEIDSINFVGRHIILGPICNWMGVHNIQCDNFGQMNWSIFQNFSEATEMTNAQYRLIESKWLGKMIAQDSVLIVFEGVETKALRVNYKLKIPSVISGGTNLLQIYFVSVPIRNKYVSCVLSQYTDSFKKTDLQQLLSEVMELK